MNIKKYALSKDKVGLLVYFTDMDGLDTCCHIPSNELSSDQVYIRDLINARDAFAELKTTDKLFLGKKKDRKYYLCIGDIDEVILQSVPTDPEGSIGTASVEVIKASIRNSLTYINDGTEMGDFLYFSDRLGIL